MMDEAVNYEPVMYKMVNSMAELKRTKDESLPELQ